MVWLLYLVGTVNTPTHLLPLPLQLRRVPLHDAVRLVLPDYLFVGFFFFGGGDFFGWFICFMGVIFVGLFVLWVVFVCIRPCPP